MKVTVAPGASVDHTPSFGVLSGEAALPKGPGMLNVSLVMPPEPKGICTAGDPCMSFTCTLDIATLPVLAMA